MKNFAYRRQVNTETVVIDKMKKKANTQQRLFTLFFIIFFLTFVGYWAFGTYVKYFQGYIVSNNVEVRMLADVSVVDVKVRQGEFVREGDTLFTYVLSGMILDHINPNTIIDPEKENISLKLQVNEAEVKSQTIKNSIDSLQLIMNRMRKDIQLGVLTLKDIEAKEWEMVNMKELYEQSQKRIAYLLNMEQEMTNSKGYKSGVNLPSSMTLTEMRDHADVFGWTMRARIAAFDSHVQAVHIAPGSVIFRTETAMSLFPYDNPSLADLHAVMLVAPEFYDEIQHGEKVSLYSGNLYLGTSTINLNATVMEKVENYKLSTFSQGTEAVCVRLEFDDPEQILVKYQLNKLPIKVVYNRGEVLMKYIKRFFKAMNNEVSI